MVEREMGMRRRKWKTQFTIDVRPFLGILAFIPLVVALVYTLATVRICVSWSSSRRLITLWGADTRPGRVKFVSSKKTTFFVCGPDGVTIQPRNTMVAWDELQRPDNAVEGLLDKIETNRSKECVVLLVQPDSICCFKLMRRILSVHNIEVSDDIVGIDFEFPESYEFLQEQRIADR